MANLKLQQRASVRRIPYYRAPFYFGPEYLATAEQWQQTFIRLADEILSLNDCGGKVIDVYDHSIKIGWGALELMVDARFGKFDLCERDDGDDQLSSQGWAGIEDTPASFVDKVRSVSAPRQLISIVRHQVAPFAEALFSKMTGRFEHALCENIARIEAQPLSPLPTTPFARIEPDQRRYFPLLPKERASLVPGSENELDEAVGPTGEKLFSFCVVPVERRLSGQATTSTPDGRKKHDWQVIDPVIKEQYGMIKLNPTRSKLQLRNRVISELGPKAPKPTALDKRINELFPTF
jgi:hypothetical protein